MNIALLTAAGTANRMHQSVPKQFLHIDDKPIIIHTMLAFEQCDRIDAIAVVTLEDWKQFVWSFANQFRISKLKYVITGGPTGQESIFNGIDVLAKDCNPSDTIIIHDGNRPLITEEIIISSIDTFIRHGSAVAAVPCTEAIYVTDNGYSSITNIPREQVVRTQTPHTYALGKLIWAKNQAIEHEISNSTAICTLMSQLGQEVFFSKGSERNIKITTIEDLEIFMTFKHSKKIDWLK